MRHIQVNSTLAAHGEHEHVQVRTTQADNAAHHVCNHVHMGSSTHTQSHEACQPKTKAPNTKQNQVERMYWLVPNVEVMMAV